MPANLTPQYLKAERWFREASTNEEKILALEEMMRVIPKHKGTDHLRADLRQKLSRLKDAGTKKAAVKSVDIFHVPKSGAGQVVLIGTPNCGKSSIVAALTNAKVNVADFTFATSTPVPGMIRFEDIQIQLVDMPPVTADYAAPGQVGTYRNCDLIAIVIDLSANIKEQMEICLDFLETRNLLKKSGPLTADESGNIRGKEAFYICTKTDIATPDALHTFEEYSAGKFEYIQVSAVTGDGIDKLPAKLFELLKIIRVYAKPPGKEPDMTEPFTLPKGANIMLLANVVHRKLAEKLKSARIWGTGVHPGQNVHLTHELHDKDIIELHFA